MKSHPRAPLLARVIVRMPDRLVLILFWTCLVVAVTVLLGAPPLKTSTITTWTYSLSHVPIDPTATTFSVWAGVIRQDGSILEVASASH